MAKKAAKKKAKGQANFSGLVALKLTDPLEIYAQLQICLSKITGFPINQIRNGDNLANKFHFTPAGQRALAQNLEACFKAAGHPIPKPLNRDQMEKAKTVGNVADILNAAFGVL